MFKRIFKKFNKKECDTKNNGVILNEYEASQGNNRNVEQSDLRLFANDCEQYKAGYPTGQEAQMLFLHRHSEALAEESRTRKGSFGFYPQDDEIRKSAETRHVEQSETSRTGKRFFLFYPQDDKIRKSAAWFSALNEFRFAGRKSATLCRKSAETRHVEQSETSRTGKELRPQDDGKRKSAETRHVEQSETSRTRKGFLPSRVPKPCNAHSRSQTSRDRTMSSEL